MPEYMNVSRITKETGTSLFVIERLRRQHRFPDPDAVMGKSELWLTSRLPQIEAIIEEHREAAKT
jgi:hypothetical protein